METLTDLLQRRAKDQASSTAYIFLDDEGRESVRITYAELDHQARRIGARLSETLKPGDRALMLYPPGPEFASAFLGCLYAGVIPVPAYPPKRNQKLNRLLSIAADATVRAALTTAQLEDRLKSSVGAIPANFAIEVISTDVIARAGDPGGFVPFKARPDDLAFLQYTSGSTGRPKGVMVSHANILHNEGVIAHAFRISPETIGCGWLPMFHDMGLVGTLLNPLFCGYPVVLLPPLGFMKRPSLWLKTMSDYKATHSGGPNFAYEMCVRQVKPEDLARLDLSHWELAFCGAEPIRAETLRRFAEHFSACGFRKSAFSPCYGLAESTLFVTGGVSWSKSLLVDRQELQTGRVSQSADGNSAGQAIVGCGRTWHDTEVRLVDPNTLEVCAEEAVGEIWVSGASVAAGYWNDPDGTREFFQAHTASGEGPFLRTGDLGFLRRGELFVTGRLKDIMIIRGRNYYPHDIEEAVEGCHPAIQAARSIAFAVDSDDQDQLVIVAEVDRTSIRALDISAVSAAVRRAVVQNLELAPSVVALVKPGGLPRTSSGKVQRGLCRDQFVKGELDTIGIWRADAEPSASTHPPGLPEAKTLVDWIVTWLAHELKVAPSSIDANKPLIDHGLDSRAGVELILALEGWLHVTIQPELLWEAPSIAELASFLLSGDELDGESNVRKHPWPSCPPAIVPSVVPRVAARRTNSEGMDFSLFFFATDQGADTEKYRLVLESARFADAHGFSGIWTPERHFHPFGGLFPNPAVLGAALARETKNVRIRAGSVVLPLNHPVRVAEEWAVVDNLSGGRVDLGFSTGWNPNDFLLKPEAYAARRQVTAEAAETVRRLWRGGTYSANNAKGEPVEVQTYPRPLQPEAPVWMTCNRDPETFIQAGASGANLLTALLLQTTQELAERIADYRRARAEHGHDPDAGVVTLMLHTFVGEDSRAVKELVRPSLTEYLRSSVTLWRQGSERLNELSERERQRLPDLAFERYFRTSSLLGTLEDCRETVRRLHGIGVDEIACLIDFGLPTKTVLEGLHQLERLKAAVSERQLVSAPASSFEPIAPATTADASWIVTEHPRPRARGRLFCFPYAGGDVNVFQGWGDLLPPTIGVHAINAPQGYEHMEQLLDEFVPAILPHLDAPFAFYGHSLGALLAFEVARRLRDVHGKEPMHFFVGAQHAPQTPFPYPTYEQLSGPGGAALIDIGFPAPKGTPDHELPSHRERTLAAIKPGVLIQSDNYTYRPGAPLRCPITVFGGSNDHMLPRHHLQEWRQHTTSDFRVEIVPGGHLFLRKHRSDLVQRLTAVLDFVPTGLQGRAY